jgi:hypothetical protein
MGSNSSTDWHNESKGAFMINRYLKEDINFTSKLKTLGKKIIEVEKLDDEEKKKFFEEEDLSENEDENEEELDNEYEIKEAQKMLKSTDDE